MSRPFFSSPSQSNNSHQRDESPTPLLPQHRNSVHLRTLSPSISPSHSRNSRSQNPSSPSSPPPSLYRDHTSPSPARPFNLSPSPDFTRPERRIQFAHPPPPLASAILPPIPSSRAGPAGGDGTSTFSSGSGSGSGNGSGFPHIPRGGTGLDPLVVLERKSKALQKDLQMLLDAQAAGLLLGFGGQDEVGSEGSRTPTRSLGSESQYGAGGRREGGGVVPVRQPRRKMVGLRGARRGLARDMGELIAVKGEEGWVLQAEISRREEILRKVRQWEERIEEGKRMVVSHSVPTNNGTEEDHQIAELRTEEKAVENEIREMEDRLAQMRARKKWLGERIRESENRREAKLSSYRGALREVEGEVKEFLRRPGVRVSVVMGEERGFEGLPVGRRTLGVAGEWWSKELSVLEGRKQAVEVERLALEEGREMWEGCNGIVTAFEDGLRVQMKDGKQQSVEDLKTQVGKMQDVIQVLEKECKTAEEKGYNLLICAIGAELEAFKEGEGILKDALKMIAGPEDKELGEVEREDSFHSTDDGLNTLKELNGAVERDEGESEDDGPDLAALLVDTGGRRGEGDVD